MGNHLLALLGAVSLLGGSAQQAGAQTVSPAALNPPTGNALFLSTTGVGYQDYICLPTAANPSVTAWVFERPESGLSIRVFGNKTLEVVENLLTPVPVPAAAPDRGCVEASDGTGQYCPAFRSPYDLSTVWTSVLEVVPSGSGESCPTAGSVPCLLLRTVTTNQGQVRPNLLGRTTYVQRLFTQGGVAPTTVCTSGQVQQVPYQANYRFFAAN